MGGRGRTSDRNSTRGNGLTPPSSLERTPTTERDSATISQRTLAQELTPERLAEECASVPPEGKKKVSDTYIFCEMVVWAREQIDALNRSVTRPPLDPNGRYVRYGRSGDTPLDEAVRAICWVMEEDEMGPGITFRDCCDALRLDVENVRRTFRRYCRRTLRPDALQALRDYAERL